MIRILLTVAVLISSADAATVAVVQADNSDFGRRHFSGFSSSATERVSAFQYEGKKERALILNIKKMAPDLVFTIGEVPIDKLVKSLPSTPFIVGSFHATSVASKANVVLMESALPIGSGLKLAQGVFPNRKTVGVLYNPGRSADTFEKLKAITAEAEMKLAGLKVNSPQDVKAFISAFSGQVDLIYWLRDSTTADEESLTALYGFAKTNKIPVITTDPSHLDRGAFLSLSIDAFELGEEAWKTADAILKEGKIPQMPVQIQPDSQVAFVSITTANDFGINHSDFHHFLENTVKEGYSVRVLP